MKTKQVFTLGLIFLVLIVGVILKEMQKPAELATQEYVPLDLSFDVEKVGKVDVSRLLNKEKDEEAYVELVKKDEGWRVKTFYDARADEAKITGFLETIKSAKGEMRAQSKEVLGDFGITEDEAFKILLLDAGGKELLSLRVGTLKNRGRSIFVRRAGENKVFMTDADIFGKMGIFGKPEESDLGTDYWVDLRLVQFDTAKAKKIEIKSFEDGGEILKSEVVKDAGKWSYVREGLPFEIDGTKVEQHLNSLQGWRAQKVLEPETEDLGFDSPQWQMKIAFDGEEDILIKAGNINEDAKAYYIQVSSEPAPFQLTHFYFENMNIDDSRFFKNNMLGADAAKLEKLTIATKTNTYEFSPAEKTWQELTDYINQLANFRPQALIFKDENKAHVKSPSTQFIELKKKDIETPLIVDIGEKVNEESREHAVTVRGNDYPFILKESDISKFFEGFDKIKNAEPSDEPEAPAQDAAAPAAE